MRKSGNNVPAARLTVRVQPRASRNAIELQADGGLRISTTAPPVSGEANDAVCVLLAKCLGIPKRDICVVSGEKSRDKIVSISGLTSTRISEMLSSLNNKT